MGLAYFTNNNYAINKGVQYKRILSISVCITILLYILIDVNFNPKLLHLKNQNDLQSSIVNNKAYFVDMHGCKMPSFNVIDETIAQYMYKVPKLNCIKPMIISNDDHLILNMNISELYDYYNITDIEKISCKYQVIYRKDDNNNDYKKDLIAFNLFNSTKITSEFIKIICFYDQKEIVYKDFHFFPLKNNLTNSNNRKESNKISVMIIGIDSVSHLNFLRQMNKTSKLLQEQFNAIELFGYNKIGDNTYPNLVPVLSGLDEVELKQACLSNGFNTSYDECPFIWKHYKDNNYRTVYAEDIAHLGLFNYFRNGFKIQPTDYYIRPILLEMEKSIAYNKHANIYLCLGGRRPVDVILEYIRKLIPSYRYHNFFSFFWMSSLTHDFFNTPTLIDDDIFNLLITLNESDILNNTVVFLMSDHGLRWGSFRKTYQGMMEERQPFLYILLPSWFLNHYPTAVSNLRQNAKKLTTHFDLHETLLDLNDLSSITVENIRTRSIELLETDSMPRGISLFLSIPKTRTCENAGIASHWCTCHEKQSLATNDPRVQKAARFIVKSINTKLNTYPQCRVLYLNSIFEAHVGATNKMILKETKANILTDITVRIQTKPGLGEFEATIRLFTDSISLTGTISRTNLYGRQSYCINDYTLKMYCFCYR